MNLIEKLGLEKCKAIVDGAPRGAEKWRDMDSVCSPNEILYYAKSPLFWVVWEVEKRCWVVSIIHDDSGYILEQLQSLEELKSQIDQYYYGQSEEKELEQYALLSQEKIEGGALFVGDQVQYTDSVDMTIYTVKEVHQDFVVASGGAFDFLTMFNDEIRKVKSLEVDHCSDIRNHVSPNTKVIER